MTTKKKLSFLTSPHESDDWTYENQTGISQEFYDATAITVFLQQGPEGLASTVRELLNDPELCRRAIGTLDMTPTKAGAAVLLALARSGMLPEREKRGIKRDDAQDERDRRKLLQYTQVLSLLKSVDARAPKGIVDPGELASYLPFEDPEGSFRPVIVELAKHRRARKKGISSPLSEHAALVAFPTPKRDAHDERTPIERAVATHRQVMARQQRQHRKSRDA